MPAPPSRGLPQAVSGRFRSHDAAGPVRGRHPNEYDFERANPEITRLALSPDARFALFCFNSNSESLAKESFRLGTLEETPGLTAHLESSFDLVPACESQLDQRILDLRFLEIKKEFVEFAVICQFDIYFFKKNLTFDNQLLFKIRFDFHSHFESNLNGYELTHSTVLVLGRKQYRPSNTRYLGILNKRNDFLVISVNSNRLMALFKRVTEETVQGFILSRSYFVLVSDGSRVLFKAVDLSSLENFAKSFQSGFRDCLFDGKIVAADLGYMAPIMPAQGGCSRLSRQNAD